jgi:hypothetical protein
MRAQLQAQEPAGIKRIHRALSESVPETEGAVKVFSVKGYENGRQMALVTLAQLWPGTEVHRWGKEAKVGDKFAFSGKEFLERVR